MGPHNVINVERIPIEDWAEFMGWYLAEGTVYYSEETSQYLIRITKLEEVHPDEYADIGGLLNRLPFTWGYRDRSFRISVKQLVSYLKQFGHSPDKFIPEYLFDTPISARKKLVDTLLRCDGRTESNRPNGVSYKERVFTTSSARLADDFERLAIGLGHSISRRIYSDNREERYHDIREVRILKHGLRTAWPGGKRGNPYYTVDYDGMVYCATVPGELLLTRRNEKTAVWLGNSDRAGLTVHFALGATKKGNTLTQRLYNVKTGRMEDVTPSVFVKSVIAFPGEYEKKGRKFVPKGSRVEVQKNGEITYALQSEVDYVMPSAGAMFDATGALIPFLHNTQGNRGLMATKHLTQALSLKGREAPLVQVSAGKNKSFEQLMGNYASTRSPADGNVTSVTKDAITIMDSAGKKHIVQLYHDFPLEGEEYLTSIPIVKKGDSVKNGQLLADSNFTRNGTLALGKNLRVGYLNHRGYNFDDGITVSETAARKLTSLHLHRVDIPIGERTVLKLSRYRARFPLTIEVLKNLDQDGVVKPGTKIDTGSMLAAVLTKRDITTPLAKNMKRFGKMLGQLPRDDAILWDKDYPGVVQEVVRRKDGITRSSRAPHLVFRTMTFIAEATVLMVT